MPEFVREYGCTVCQQLHREGSDPLFEPHLYHQSKHGWHYVPKDRIYFALNVDAMVREFEEAIQKQGKEG